jgi:hypothetical protein
MAFLVEVLLLVTCDRTSTKKSHLNNDTSSITGYMWYRTMIKKSIHVLGNLLMLPVPHAMQHWMIRRLMNNELGRIRKLSLDIVVYILLWALHLKSSDVCDCSRCPACVVVTFECWQYLWCCHYTFLVSALLVCTLPILFCTHSFSL